MITGKRSPLLERLPIHPVIELKRMCEYAVESLQPCQSFRRHLIGCFFPCRNCGPFLVRLQLLVPSCNQGVYLALQKVYFRRTQFFMELQVVVPEIDEVAKNASAIHAVRSEEHTSELQSLMRISYAVFCLNKKK